MTGLNKIVVATAAAVGIALAASAYAHGPGFGYGPGGGMMGGGMMGGGMMGGSGFGMHAAYGGGPGSGPCLGASTPEARLDAIKTELKLTAKQTKAWEAFEKAVRTQVQTMAAGRPDWSQSADEHIAFMEQRLAGMKAVQAARTDLYSALTPEQKAVADRYWLRGPRS